MIDSTNQYMEKKEYQTAIDWGERALTRAEKEFWKKDRNYLDALQLLIQCHYYNGDIAKSVQYSEVIKKLMFETKGEESGEYAEATGNLGFLYDELGRYAMAEPLYVEALKIRRKLFAGDHPDLANSINNLAMFYNERGDYKQAEPLLKEGLEMYHRIYQEDAPALATSINNMAIFYLGIGDYKQAEPLFVEALDMRRRIFVDDNTELAQSINNLAAFYRDRGFYKRAEDLYKEAIGMFRRIYKTDHPELAMSINNMAVLERDRGNYEEAEDLCKEALDMYRRLYKRDHPDLAMSIYNMAGFYIYRGDYEQGEEAIKEAVDMYKRIYKSGHPDLAMSINNLAAINRARGDNKKAENLYLEALEDYKNMLNNYFPSLSENEKKLFWNKVSNNFEAFNSFVVKRHVENPNITCSMFDMQLYTKGILFNSTMKVKMGILNSNDSGLIEKYKELSEKKEQLVKLYMMNKDARQRSRLNIDSIEKIANKLEKELSLKSEQFAQSQEKSYVNWKSVRALLKNKEAAVETVRFRYSINNNFTDTVFYAFLIVTRKTMKQPELLLLENGKFLENEYYNDYRYKIKNRIIDTLSYQRYWGKLGQKLKGFTRIYFSSDGIYSKLNPATFLMADGKFLLETIDIQQVNSTKDLVNSRSKKQMSKGVISAILIGNPDFSAFEERIKDEYSNKDNELKRLTTGAGLTSLPGTEKEVKEIETLLKGKKIDVKTFLGSKASKSVVKTAKSPSILHIATHGLFLEDVKRVRRNLGGYEDEVLIENPLLRSGLFFAKEDDEQDDAKQEESGLLTAYEAMGLELDSTELVVLSGCETGLGEVINGEGVYGLRRAFQQAGAKTVVMSLWAVDDKSTQELMSSFYRNWVSGMSKRDAFNKAQIEIKGKYQFPYYWGGFVMVGE